jgi:hypothetical protein
MLEFILTVILHVLDKSGLVPVIQYCYEEVPSFVSHIWNWYFCRNPLKWFDESTEIMIRNHTKWPGRSLFHLIKYIPKHEGDMVLSTYDTNWVIKPNLKEWLAGNGPNQFKALINLETGDIHVRVKFASADDAVMCRLLWSA